MAIRQEIQRFESVHPSIYAIYDLIDLIPDGVIAQQIRDHVVCIEGKLQFCVVKLYNILHICQYGRDFRAAKGVAGIGAT